ncbi:MAG: hypothetical protein IIW39_00110, partial [Clostridia bacterium]|nr:hypothetical protein [Clostridia bacterium]
MDFAVREFLFGSAFRFAVKIRPLQLSQLAVSAPGGAHWLPPRGRFGFNEPTHPKQKSRALHDFFVLAEKEGFFADYVACRAVPPHSRFLRLANPWRQKRVPDTFFLALQIPSDQNKKAVLCTTSLFWRRRRDLNPRASCPT